jgi:hypothetical protein
MATRKQKQELMDMLRHGPKTYDVLISGYGGEITIGSINQTQYDFWKDRSDLDEHCNSWDPQDDVPEQAVIVTQGNWHDCDDLVHENGCEFSNLCYITVYDQATNQQVFECALGYDELEKAGIDPDGFHSDEFYVRFDSSADYALMSQSIEKGTFFTGEIQTIGPFDPRRLSFSTIDVEGWQLVNGVSYESVIIDDTGGYSTTGKSLEFNIFKVEK